ncbi:exocyst complex component 1 [Venturia canescens]|uniref:exocyst complex component 1 n=1 Tax=Venturia canescens TaxID=32260 RepID=UPI001C9C8BAB|nr:exocyst complex component 1 [Venturia canescens]XP_043276361.1 exocyst complex component 1 [Venturia canescens]XP_043276363.1 exocyst complex component 1 [Venturia canescens]
MAAIRHTLQREVFTPSDEKLLSVCFVSKTYKRKKTSFLCLATSTDSPDSTLLLYQVKKNDKNVYKKKQSWLLTDIQTVDGINNDSLEMELHIDKVYKWLATAAQERRTFISNLYTYSCALPQRPEFKNIPKDWLVDPTSLKESDSITLTPDLLTPVITSDYQPITDKELVDLTKLMADCNYAISNAELFMETLAKDLSVLDGENVQSVLASETRVVQLMNGIEAAIDEASVVESRLISIDETMGMLRDAMAQIRRKNHEIKTENNNVKLLLDQLDDLITHLDITNEDQRILNDAELPGGRVDLTIAGGALLKAISTAIPTGLDKMGAVNEQRRRLDKLRAKFSLIVARHLNNLFIHLGNDVGDVSASTGDLLLPTHQAVHRELEPYMELMQLLRALDNKAFQQLTKVYTGTMSKLYQRDLKLFFEEAKNRLINTRPHANSSKSSSQKGEDLIAPAPLCLLSGESWAPQGEGALLDSLLDRALSQLQPVCLAEQAFCVAFLQLDVVLSPSKSTENEESENTSNGATSPGSATSTASKKLERQINEEVRATMAAIFPSLEPELNNFILFLDKIDSFWCMYVLVRLSQHVMSAQDTGSFLSMTFASALVQVKRAFDKFMQAQLQSILRDTKVNRRHKCGILPYVENFGPFARTAEKIFKNSDRKVDLEKWYTKLVDAMFEAIIIHSGEHHKTPQEVIKMENYHHLYDLLSQLKISVLDHERKEAKQKYHDALKAYVIQYFGRPLEKLNLFFEGVQAKVGAGVKESEISYQMAFSKQELRRVVKEYPAREVKKGLEHLYRKVEKHLCEEENLLQVVWREMQGEFIAQYVNIQELIQRCYPDSNVTLEFTIQNILEFFSEIARSH